MKIFKFGGASIKDPDAIRNVAGIISDYKNNRLLVVISALGKTTNALEEIVDAFYNKSILEAAEKIRQVENNHLEIAKSLIPDVEHPLFPELQDLFTELKNVPERYDTTDYNFLYDQVVCFGELLSTVLVSHYLKIKEIPSYWLDVRQVLKTDNAYREAKINYDITGNQIQDKVIPVLKDQIIITQGFIGSTSGNHTTTLGREGSDFTAAIFAYFLDGEELVIWKDVPGVLNANPTLFKDTVKIDSMSYEEAIEMTYYGAQVIHPKTIKPLQNKNIPLHVRSFINKDKSGTIINNRELPGNMPPIIVFKRNQVSLLLSTKDFSFMAEENLGRILESFARLRIKTNIMQNAAISLLVCIDNIEDKIAALIYDLEPHFNISKDDAVEVLTIRHYNNEIVNKLIENKDILITQKTKDTVQFVCK